MKRHIKPLILPTLVSLLVFTWSGAVDAQSVSCAEDTIKVCDNTLGQSCTLVLRDLPDNYSQLSIAYKISLMPNETLSAGGFVSNIEDNKFNIALDSYTLSDIEGGLEAGYADVTLTLTKVQLSNSDYDKYPLEITGGGSTTWRIYGKPVASDALPADDPHRLSLITPLSNCGYEGTVKTDPHWRDISTWQWIAEGTEFAVDANKDTAFFSSSHYDAEGNLLTTIKTVRVKIIKTVGNTCSASFTRDISFTGSPEAILAREEWGVDEPVRICTSIGENEDPNRYVSGQFSVDGHAPFTLQLTTGDTFTYDKVGVHTFPYIHVTDAQVIRVADVYDRNGCHATNATKHGSITVVDRKPTPSFAVDSVVTEGTEAHITLTATSESHQFTWGVSEGSQNFASIDANMTTATAYSTVSSIASYYVIETDLDGDAPCPSDTVSLSVDFSMPLRTPGGFSPNGDGRNDRFVIEGLPENNSVTVVDGHGKQVFQADNYRNDWDAQGVADGYYVYVLQGDGIKPIKQTLVIKRSK